VGYHSNFHPDPKPQRTDVKKKTSEVNRTGWRRPELTDVVISGHHTDRSDGVERRLSFADLFHSLMFKEKEKKKKRT
jgi:hypothetical protein